MTNSANPVQDALAAAAAQVQPEQAAEVVQQEQQASQNVQQAQTLAPAVAQTHAVAAHQPAAVMSMDDASVAAVSGVSAFVKLRDGGLELDEQKFGPTKFKLKIEGSHAGGSFQPFHACNYNSPAGYVYTKTYDNATTVSLNAAHNGMPWAENVALCKQKDPTSYTYLGFELTLELAEDTTSLDGKVTIPAGTMFGYSTPYTASKLLKGVWDKALAAGKRGENILIELSGEEIKNDKGNFKKLILKEV